MLEIEVDLLTTGMVEQSSMSSQIGGLEEEEDARFSGEKMRDFERARPLEEGEAEAGGGRGRDLQRRTGFWRTSLRRGCRRLDEGSDERSEVVLARVFFLI